MDKNVKRLRFFWGVLRVEGELKKERFVLRVGTLRLTFLEHFVLRIIIVLIRLKEGAGWEVKASVCKGCLLFDIRPILVGVF